MKNVNYMLALLALCLGTCAYADVQCLSGDTAKEAFVSETTEPYFSLLQPREMAAKTGHRPAKAALTQQQSQLRGEYRKSVMNCTSSEAKALEGYIAIIESRLKPDYPGLVAMPWRFVKVEDSIEGGLPHTRGDVIVLSQSMLTSIERTARSEKWDLNIIDVLIHEQIHVIQRTKAAAFEKLYENEWGFRKATSIKGAGEWLAAHQIVNPDGVDVLWVWPVPNTSRTIWPRVIIDDDNDTPVMPDDFRMIGIELNAFPDGYVVATEKSGTPQYHLLQDEESYMRKFGAISSIYHPNEIAADYLAHLAVFDCIIDKSRISKEQMAAVEEIYRPIRSWARSTFGAKSN